MVAVTAHSAVAATAPALVRSRQKFAAGVGTGVSSSKKTERSNVVRQQ
jgi:hypothetical protein